MLLASQLAYILRWRSVGLLEAVLLQCTRFNARLMRYLIHPSIKRTGGEDVPLCQILIFYCLSLLVGLDITAFLSNV